jgi:hypothetical protein|tara:strand:- start:944 stop:1144 length:201 start_codon:yes stop_codon:yes gene_type:complete
MLNDKQNVNEDDKRNTAEVKLFLLPDGTKQHDTNENETSYIETFLDNDGTEKTSSDPSKCYHPVLQ